MAEDPVLAQLKDIHLPDPISWWPLAPGWYGLMAFSLFLVGGLVYFFHKKAVYARPKKQALKLLAVYKQTYEQERNSQLTSSCVSELLKRVALVYYPREQVAGLQGRAWLTFLNDTSKGIDFNCVAALLLESPFKTAETRPLHPLISKAECWIKQRRTPCSN